MDHLSLFPKIHHTTVCAGSHSDTLLSCGMWALDSVQRRRQSPGTEYELRLGPEQGQQKRAWGEEERRRETWRPHDQALESWVLITARPN